ncbi:hypothetical protein D0T90_03420 [Neisseria animalis]|uniref:Uncharacterized protein n=1 Tax=Neisseria animalis TaxID=492 RepID=A0A5P3MQ78_NEIAN|nr:hypothetical protein D0T90_03420 [Neisseria animalis]ROW32812.1 hypothetical protein CGZ60_03040 [Neisseria animalis]
MDYVTHAARLRTIPHKAVSLQPSVFMPSKGRLQNNILLFCRRPFAVGQRIKPANGSNAVPFLF